MPRYSRRTALIVVDVQNDFADASGSLYVSGGEQVVEAVNAEIVQARASGALIVYTQDWHPPSTPHFQKDGGVWPDHCVQDTWGAAFHPALDVGGQHIRKGADGSDAYSGFSTRHPVSGEQEDTDLGALLRERGIEHVVVAGLATDYCVKDTAMDAVRLGWTATVPAHAIAAVNLEPSDGEEAIEAMRQAGVQVV